MDNLLISVDKMAVIVDNSDRLEDKIHRRQEKQRCKHVAAPQQIHQGVFFRLSEEIQR